MVNASMFTLPNRVQYLPAFFCSSENFRLSQGVCVCVLTGLDTQWIYILHCYQSL